MRNPNENERLRAEFFRQYGKPLERVRGVRAARGGSKASKAATAAPCRIAGTPTHGASPMCIRSGFAETR